MSEERCTCVTCQGKGRVLIKCPICKGAGSILAPQPHPDDPPPKPRGPGDAAKVGEFVNVALKDV